jgi:hypothetical protein
MKTLIVYYSFSQNNEKLANRLRLQLECSIARIETKRKHTGLSIFLDIFFKRKPALKPLAVDLRNYEHIIFVAPVWAGKIATPIKSFLIDQQKYIRSYSLITLCGGGSPNQRDNIGQELFGVIGTPPVVVTELWMADIAKETKAKSVTGLKIEETQLDRFEGKINEFVQSIDALSPEKLSV